MKSPVLAMIVLTAAACTPRLYSNAPPDTGSGDPTDWQAPDNSWETCSEPTADMFAATTGWQVGDLAPDFRMIDQHGDETSLWQFHGCVTLLDLSTLWCGPCRKLAAEVDEVWNEYKSDGFMYLTLISQNELGADPTGEDLTWWADEFGVSAPVLADNLGVSDTLTPEFPYLVLIDRDSNVRNRGFEPTLIEAEIEAALE